MRGTMDLALRRLELSHGRAILFEGPAAPEKLLDAIDAATFAEDERMPYWGESWPAGAAFARHVAQGGVPLAGKGVLELGCGLGLVGIAAAMAGAREVTLTDYFEESIALALANARRNGVGERCRTRNLDWRHPPSDLRPEVILGADLLYETRNVPVVAAAVRALLAPSGVAFIADPDRITSGDFAARCEAAGLTVRRHPLPGLRGTIYELRELPR